MNSPHPNISEVERLCFWSEDPDIRRKVGELRTERTAAFNAGAELAHKYKAQQAVFENGRLVGFTFSLRPSMHWKVRGEVEGKPYFTPRPNGAGKATMREMRRIVINDYDSLLPGFGFPQILMTHGEMGRFQELRTDLGFLSDTETQLIDRVFVRVPTKKLTAFYLPPGWNMWSAQEERDFTAQHAKGART